MNVVLKGGNVDPAAQAATLSAKTILVVEDSAADSDLLLTMFKRFRILNPVEIVCTLHDAICYLKGEGQFADRDRYPFPTLLMVDSHLSDGSGFDLLRWLQRHKAQAPLGVVMLTGSDLQSYKLSYDLGAQSFLSKPLRFADFENMVRSLRGMKLTSTTTGHLLEVT